MNTLPSIDEDVPPPPPLPEDDQEDEIDFVRLAQRAAEIAREQRLRQEKESSKSLKRKMDDFQQKRITTTSTTSTTTNNNNQTMIPQPPPIDVPRRVQREELKRLIRGDRSFGIALSSCYELANKKYFFSRKKQNGHRSSQWETPKALKGGLQKNLRICPVKATLLSRSRLPKGWVELKCAVDVDTSAVKSDDSSKTRKNVVAMTEEASYYWNPSDAVVTWRRPRRASVVEAEIIPLEGLQDHEVDDDDDDDDGEEEQQEEE
jgi:hypothetical protein